MHREQSLANIDFDDFDPGLAKPLPLTVANGSASRLVQDRLFTVDLLSLASKARVECSGTEFRILGVVEGSLRVHHNGKPACDLQPGQFCLIPASVAASTEALDNARFLSIQAGR